jgi:signal transduction histidine kinase
MVREEAYRITGEALRNAVKHAQARRVTVTIHTSRGSCAW